MVGVQGWKQGVQLGGYCRYPAYICVCIFERYVEDGIIWTWWQCGCGGPVRGSQSLAWAAGWMAAPSSEKRTSIGRTGSGETQVCTLEWVWGFMSPPSGCLWEAVAQVDLKLMNKVRAASRNLWITNKCRDQLMLLWKRGGGGRESLGLSPKELQCLFIWQIFRDSLLSETCVGTGDTVRNKAQSQPTSGSAYQRNRSWSRFCGVWHSLRKGV